MKSIISFLLFCSVTIFSQTPNPYPATSSQNRFEAFKHKLELQNNSLLKNVELRSVGPSIMSGRVTDIDVSPDDPTIFYVAYATGGLWKTANNGISFDPLFDEQASITIGDIAVDWKHGEAIWVGTGEKNSSRSSYAGTGVYKSVDTGKTWQFYGLAETQHLSRIILDPEDTNTVWVAAIGHLYSPNPERGVFKTTDGGKTWRKTLYIDDNTGVIDLAADPVNRNILYAASWYRMRRAWDFKEAGKQSGIYKSTDGGETWFLLTDKNSGFPVGNGVGRIGLALNPKNPQMIYAVVDNQAHREKKEEKEKPVITKNLLKHMSKEEFLKLKEDDINNYLDEYDFPEKYSANKITNMIKSDKIKPSDLVDYLGDANQNLFDTPVIGAEVYLSTNSGKTWKRTHKKYIDDLYYTYGYYFGEIRINPFDENEIYLLGVPAIKSTDGGKTFKSINQKNMHGDFHALWIDPNREGHLIIGNDGGINISYDNGKTYFKANTPAVGQFYSVNVDMANPYNVYGGLQDNGVWYGPSNYKPSYLWYSTGQYPYKAIMGGDGMQVAVDTTNNNIVYTGFQFGYYYRVNKQNQNSTPIKPSHSLGEKPLRFNWQTPILLSTHNPDIFYIGSNMLHRSLDRGDHYETISGDLTKGGIKGDVPYGTLTSITESPLKFGLIYTGSDDGLLYITKDGGSNWLNISNGLPENLWISRVTASSFDTATVYVSLNGYRWDDFNSYLYKSTSYGKTWEKIGATLPAEPINVVREDPENKDILYVGTDNGLYVSLDNGKTFMGLFKGMPAVPVHDVVVQKRDKDLVVGTHGRSIYIADVKYIEQLTPEILKKEIHLFPIIGKLYSDTWGKKNNAWQEPYEPGMQITFYAKYAAPALIRIKTDSSQLLREIKQNCDRGLNFINYDLSIDSSNADFYKNYINSKLSSNKKDTFEKTVNNKIYLRPGKYTTEVEIDGRKEIQSFEIKAQKKKSRNEKESGP